MESIDIFIIKLKTSDVYFENTGWNGPNWTMNENKAKIYVKLSNARRRVTLLTNEKPSCPSVIVKMTATFVEILDEVDRIKKAKEARVLKDHQHKIYSAKCKMENAQKEMERAKNDLDNAKKELGIQ
jgi:hypothetical protein